MNTSSAPKLLPLKYMVLLVATAWIFAGIFGGKSTLLCTRGSSQPEQCEVKDLSLFSTDRSIIIPLKDIKKVDVIADSDNEDPSAILVLVTNNEQVAIGTSGNYDEKDKIAAQLSWFLEDVKATTFNLTDGNQTLSWWLLGLSTAVLLNYLYQLIRSKKQRC